MPGNKRLYMAKVPSENEEFVPLKLAGIAVAPSSARVTLLNMEWE